MTAISRIVMKSMHWTEESRKRAGREPLESRHEEKHRKSMQLVLHCRREEHALDGCS
jgi:hypothetical protein